MEPMYVFLNIPLLLFAQCSFHSVVTIYSSELLLCALTLSFQNKVYQLC